MQTLNEKNGKKSETNKPSKTYFFYLFQIGFVYRIEKIIDFSRLSFFWYFFFFSFLVQILVKKKDWLSVTLVAAKTNDWFGILG